MCPGPPSTCQRRIAQPCDAGPLGAVVGTAPVLVAVLIEGTFAAGGGAGGEGLGEEVLGLLIAAALAHVGEMGLVRLGGLAFGGIVLVGAGGPPAAGAVPFLRDLDVERERQDGLVSVGAPVPDVLPWHRLAAFQVESWVGADSSASDGLSVGHMCDRSSQTGDLLWISTVRACGSQASRPQGTQKGVRGRETARLPEVSPWSHRSERLGHRPQQFYDVKHIL